MQETQLVLLFIILAHGIDHRLAAEGKEMLQYRSPIVRFGLGQPPSNSGGLNESGDTRWFLSSFILMPSSIGLRRWILSYDVRSVDL